MRYVLILCLLLQEDQESPQNHDGQSTDDLVLALESAEKSVEQLQDKVSELWSLDFQHDQEKEMWRTEFESLTWELERDGRAILLNRLERVLVQRFMAPVDLWMENPHAANSPFPKFQHGECWYALMIEPVDRLKSQKLWVKFAVNSASDGGLAWYSDAQNDSIIQHAWKEYRRAGLLDALERHLALSLDDPELVPTIMEGMPHLYRLVTKDSDIDKLSKEDRIY